MRLKDLRLRHFRNHTSTRVECAEDRNLFLGNNGEGKTNILEAISYLCLTKSFYASTDATAVQLGQTGFAVTGELVSDIDVPYEVDVTYVGDTREKKITINGAEAESKSSVIGMFPLVVLSPEHGTLTMGAPVDRRRFVDIVVSQSSRSYLEHLIEYRRVLRQRNKILLESRLSQRFTPDVIEPWSEEIVKYGAQISRRRAEFVQEFAPLLEDAFRKIASPDERPTIAYDSSIPQAATASREETERAFRDELQRQESEERRLGTTLVGPHKDEFVFEISGLGLRSFASQGQHKTFLVALKVAEFFYLWERCKDTPLLLLDDVFSELDDLRSARLLSLTEELGQTFITATDGRRFSPAVKQQGMAAFHVHDGQVSYAEPPVIA